jgi:hypothetical protein
MNGKTRKKINNKHGDGRQSMNGEQEINKTQPQKR